jgi:uridine kinase
VFSPRLGRIRLVAIDGPSGAGKSTFAALLCEEFERRAGTVAVIEGNVARRPPALAGG